MTLAWEEGLLRRTVDSIEPADADAAGKARAAWDAVAKPLGGLGLFEETLCRIAGAQHTSDVEVSPRAVAVFCADNGVVCEGVSQSDHSVTTAVARNLCDRATSVCRMAAEASCEVVPVDVGMIDDVDDERLLVAKTAHGTDNIACGAAMSREAAVYAMEAGVHLAITLAEKGCKLLAAGEMGIGNTTTSAALACALLSEAPETMVGRGAGLSTAGLARKIDAVHRALAKNGPDQNDPVGAIAKVGGFDIAAMCGFYLGCAAKRVPAVLDGVISCVAALAACRIAPDAAGYLIASHVSSEPAARIALDALGLSAPIAANMHLGEGTGAVALMPLLDLAHAVYTTSASFSDTGIDAYEVLV